MESRVSSTCSSSSVAFHRAAWVRGEVDDREEGVGLGRLGLAQGDREAFLIFFVCLIFPFLILLL